MMAYPNEGSPSYALYSSATDVLGVHPYISKRAVRLCALFRDLLNVREIAGGPYPEVYFFSSVR